MIQRSQRVPDPPLAITLTYGEADKMTTRLKIMALMALVAAAACGK